MGLMFPKPGASKRHRRHAKGSILQAERDRRRCWLCMEEGDFRERRNLEKHHVYMGPLREISEAEGFFVWLCPFHHTMGRRSVHMEREASLRLQKEMQAAFERAHTREEFRALIGKSYL